MKTDKEKLTLKEVAGYLPYGVKMIHNSVKAKHGDEKKLRLWVMDLGFMNIELTIKNADRKLILRPLTDLTKEITHNGEIFVPLVKLAEINLKKFNWKLISNSNRVHSEKLYVEFYFNGKDFRCVNQNYDAVAQNQSDLFEKLNEWHFDWKYNLIERNLAININDLPNE